MRQKANRLFIRYLNRWQGNYPNRDLADSEVAVDGEVVICGIQLGLDPAEAMPPRCMVDLLDTAARVRILGLTQRAMLMGTLHSFP